MAAPVVGDDVVLVLLVSLSTAFTVPAAFAPLQRAVSVLEDYRQVDLSLGKLAALFRLVLLPLIGAISWTITGFDVATLTTTGGFPLFYVSWFFWGVALSVAIYAFLQLTVWSDLG